MKLRIFKNWATSLIGLVMLLCGIFMFVSNNFGILEKEFGLLEYLPVIVLGYVFLTAKDTLLEGLFLKVFKVKEKE